MAIATLPNDTVWPTGRRRIDNEVRSALLLPLQRVGGSRDLDHIYLVRCRELAPDPIALEDAEAIAIHLAGARRYCGCSRSRPFRFSYSDGGPALRDTSRTRISSV
jgi:hypothetical protein